MRRWLFAVSAPLILLLAACSASTQPSSRGLDFSLPEASSEVFTTSSSPDLSSALVAQLASADKVNHTFSNGYRVSFRIANGYILTGGDIIVGEATQLPALISRYESAVSQGVSMMVAAQGVGLVPGSSTLWSNKQIPYAIDSTFTASESQLIQQAVNAWNATNVVVKYVPASVTKKGKGFISSKPFVYYTKSSTGCGSSYVGNANRLSGGSYNGQPITIGQTCIRTAVAHHEMGHATGLWHEQQRCDRDLFVIVNSTDNTNYGKRCGNGVTDYNLYDFGSVMHYKPDGSNLIIRNPLPANGWTGDPAQAGQAPQIGSNDIVAIVQMYQ